MNLMLLKIAGIKMCESYNRQYGESHKIDYRSVMPTNLYGPGDNYHPINSHVIPELIYRFHEAKVKNFSKVVIWGTGKPRREFLYVDDMARASIEIMNMDIKTYNENISPMSSHINIGSGSDLTIKELAEIIKEVVGYQGKISFDQTKPDGVPRKLLNIERLKKFNFQTFINLKDGLIKTYKDYVNI